MCRLQQLSEPDETANEKEKVAFQTAIKDRLDIILTLYETVHKAFQGLLLFFFLTFFLVVVNTDRLYRNTIPRARSSFHPSS